jgi:hypothetical protein
MQLTSEQLSTLRHILGINTPWDRIPKPYRNHAAVVPGDSEYVELERLGMVENCGKPSWSEYDFYRCTDAGKLAAMQSYRDIRYSKEKRRYYAFLSVSDYCPDLTFHQFLTHPEYKEIRENA